MVKKLELTSKHKDLIRKSLVKSRLYTTANKGLDELIALVAKKSALFLSTLSDDTTLEKFLDKAAENILSKHQKNEVSSEAEILEIFEHEKQEDTAIFQIKEESAQKKEAVEENDIIFQINEEIDFEKLEEKNNEIPLYTEEKIAFDISCDELPTLNPEKLYEHIEDPKDINKTKTVPADVANKILDILTEAGQVEETKDYIKIFYLKYIKKLKQAQIAKKLHISEIELSQKYFEMVKYVKNNLYPKSWLNPICSDRCCV